MMHQNSLNLLTYCKNKILGFSLIEVLIALAMTAIGLLGFMQLQMRALYTAQEAAFTLSANILARDMIGRVLANPRYDYFGPMYAYNQTVPIDISLAPLPVDKALCYNPLSAPNGNGCRHDQLAALDLYEWSLQVSKMLPNGRAIICNDLSYNPGGNNANPGSTTCTKVYVGIDSTLTIKIFWQARDLTWRNYLAYIRPYNRE